MMPKRSGHRRAAAIRLWLIAACGLLLISCSAEQAARSSSSVVEGTIRTIGNEPFSRLAIELDGEAMYLLQLSDDDRMLLFSNQGKKARIYYSGMKFEPYGRVLYVLSVNLIEGP